MEKIIYAGSVGTPASIGKYQKGSISGNGEGVYTLRINNDYSIDKINVYPVDNGGIICKSRNGKYIYCANESRTFDKGINASGGGITAFRIKDNGTLEKLNESISYGSRTSYVSVTDDNEYLICSNHGSHSAITCHYILNDKGEYELERHYDDSSLALFKLNKDGSIGNLCDLKVFDGHGYWIYGGGQTSSHLHCVKILDDYVIGANRGADELEICKIDRESEKLIILDRFKTRKAVAPRHIEIDKNRNMLYVCNENYPCVTTYSFMNGKLEEKQHIATTLDEKYLKYNPLPNFLKDHCAKDEENTSVFGDFSRLMPADIHLSNDGKYLYISNRKIKKGPSNLAVFSVIEDGEIKLLQNYDLPGNDPRGFNILDDNHLIVSLLDKNIVVVLETKNGTITKEVSRTEINSVASFSL